MEQTSLNNTQVSEEQLHKVKMDLKNLHDIYKKKRDERNTRVGKIEQQEKQLKELSQERDKLIITASSLEKKYGVPGFIIKLAEQLAKEKTSDDLIDEDPLRAMKKELDDALGASLEPAEMATIIDKTQRLLSERQKSLKPLNDQVKDLRKRSADLAIERGERKVQYDALKEQLETTSAALESNVQGLRRTVAQEAERYYKLDTDLTTLQFLTKRLANPEQAKKYSVDLEEKIRSYENTNRKLKAQLRDIRNTPSDKKKMQAWGNLLAIFEAKQAAVKNSQL